jgi:hypothetical protein
MIACCCSRRAKNAFALNVKLRPDLTFLTVHYPTEGVAVSCGLDQAENGTC